MTGVSLLQVSPLANVMTLAPSIRQLLNGKKWIPPTQQPLEREVEMCDDKYTMSI